MTARVKSLADRLLARFVPAVDAGACVPEHGSLCYCLARKQIRYNCYGGCVQTQVPC